MAERNPRRSSRAAAARASADDEDDLRWLSEAEDDGDVQGSSVEDAITDKSEPFAYLLSHVRGPERVQSVLVSPALDESDPGAWIGQPTGLRETVALLRRDSDMNRVFAFAEWPLLTSPTHALTIFTRSLRSCGELPIPRVVEYLSRQPFVEAAARNPAAGVLRPFLEHCVFEVGHADAALHTRLAEEYIPVVLQLRGSGSAGMAASALSVPQQPALRSPNRGPGSVLAEEGALGGTVSDRPDPGSEGGMLGLLRGQLVLLLQDSATVDPAPLLALVRDSSLYEERVLLHARSGDHAAALRLLVFDIADHSRAVRYCQLAQAMQQCTLNGSLRVTSQLDAAASGADTPVAPAGLMRPPPAVAAGEKGAASIVGGRIVAPFLVLLGIYLDAHKAELARMRASQVRATVVTRSGASSTLTLPTAATVSSSSVYLQRAMDLLNSDLPGLLLSSSSDSSGLSPQSGAPLSDVARVLPGDLPLSVLAGFLARAVPASAHAVRDAAVMKNLYNLEYICVHSELVDRQGRSAIINRTTYCHVCDQRIGDTVFALLPDNRPVHFVCLRDGRGFSGRLGTEAVTAGKLAGGGPSGDEELQGGRGSVDATATAGSYGRSVLGLSTAAGPSSGATFTKTDRGLWLAQEFGVFGLFDVPAGGAAAAAVAPGLLPAGSSARLAAGGGAGRRLQRYAATKGWLIRAAATAQGTPDVLLRSGGIPPDLPPRSPPAAAPSAFNWSQAAMAAAVAASPLLATLTAGCPPELIRPPPLLSMGVLPAPLNASQAAVLASVGGLQSTAQRGAARVG
jgi:hypothetical protein